MIVSLPKSLTDRPVLLSCLVFTSVAAIWYLQRKSSSNHQVSFNEAILSIIWIDQDTWQHLAQASRVSLQYPQFPHPSTGSRSFEANSLRSSVYLFQTKYIYMPRTVQKSCLFGGHLLTVMWALQTALCCRTSALLQAGVQYHTLKSRFEKII